MAYPNEMPQILPEQILNPKLKRKESHGFSLVEIVISMFILALFVLAFTKGLTYTKYTAEDNLYEATAMTVAVSIMEQMKGANNTLIESPPTDEEDGKEIFTITIEDNQTRDLTLDEENTISIPIVTNKDGSLRKNMDLKITPTIEAMNSLGGYWLTVSYSYEHPQSGRVRTAVVRNARSSISTY
jgi:prepilin-type N-terminal cleavage/methylation domain-containing protein